MTTRVHDEAHLFSSADLERLQSISVPFELHVLTSTSSPSRSALETRVHHEVDGPNVVAIGVDPTHHWAIVHFGNGTGISPSSWSAVLDAGKADFHDAKWADGILKSAGKASQMKTSATVVANQHNTPSNGNTGLWVFGGLVLAVAAVVGYLWWRARRKEREFAERAASIGAGPYRSPGSAPADEPVRARGGYAPSAAPSTVVINQGGSNDLLTGYVIGSSLHQPTVVEREVRHTPSYSSDSSSSYSSSYDSGGSSFDSGGGGGFDSGGGGCDF